MTPHDIPALSVDELQKQARLWIERGAFQYALAFNRAILKSDPKNLEALRFVARATDDIEVADDLWRSAESLEQFSFDDYQIGWCACMAPQSQFVPPAWHGIWRSSLPRALARMRWR